MTRRRFLDGLAAPRAPERLRLRALGAARAEMTGAARTNLVDRLWGHRPLRWAWTTACLALILGHLMVGSQAPERSTAPSRSTVAAFDDPLLDWLIAARGDHVERRNLEESRRVAEILALELS